MMAIGLYLRLRNKLPGVVTNLAGRYQEFRSGDVVLPFLTLEERETDFYTNLLTIEIGP